MDLALRGWRLRSAIRPLRTLPVQCDAVSGRGLPARAPWRSGWRPFRRSSLAALSIVFVESSPSAAGDGLDLGTAVSLAEAHAEAPLVVLVPTGEIGEPDQVYVDEAGGVYQVRLVYRSDNGSVSVYMLITQFQARTEQDVAVKDPGPGSRAEPITVRGEPGRSSPVCA